MDAVALRTAWNRLVALVNEQAASLQRTAFSNVVREAGGLAGDEVGWSKQRFHLYWALSGWPGME